MLNVSRKRRSPKTESSGKRSVAPENSAKMRPGIENSSKTSIIATDDFIAKKRDESLKNEAGKQAAAVVVLLSLNYTEESDEDCKIIF